MTPLIRKCVILSEAKDLFIFYLRIVLYITFGLNDPAVHIGWRIFMPIGGCKVFTLQQHSHEAIIPPITYKWTQAELERRITCHATGGSIFSGRLYCGQCGQIYGPKVWHSNDMYRRIVWRCNDMYIGRKCTTLKLTESGIQMAFEHMLKKYAKWEKERNANLREILDDIADTSSLEEQIMRLETDREENSILLKKTARSKNNDSRNQGEHAQRYDELAAKERCLIMVCSRALLYNSTAIPARSTCSTV